MAKSPEELKAANDGKVLKLPSPKKCKAAMATLNQGNAEIDSIKGEMGAALKEQKATGLNLGALKLCRKLQRMEDGARADFLAQLDHMRKIFDLDNVGTLDLEGEDEGEGKPEEAEAA